MRWFVSGASYLFVSIYSLGLAIYLADKVMPISGYVAMVTVPDALFPYEIMIFIAIGATFAMASLVEFTRTIRLLGRHWEKSA